MYINVYIYLYIYIILLCFNFSSSPCCFLLFSFSHLCLLVLLFPISIIILREEVPSVTLFKLSPLTRCEGVHMAHKQLTLIIANLTFIAVLFRNALL